MNCLKLICGSKVTYKLLVYFATHDEPIHNRMLARKVKEDPGNTVRSLRILKNYGFLTSTKERIPKYQKADIFPANELNVLASLLIKGGQKQK